jgi:hypothetical protein
MKREHDDDDVDPAAGVAKAPRVDEGGARPNPPQQPNGGGEGNGNGGFTAIVHPSPVAAKPEAEYATINNNNNDDDQDIADASEPSTTAAAAVAATDAGDTTAKEASGAAPTPAAPPQPSKPTPWGNIMGNIASLDGGILAPAPSAGMAGRAASTAAAPPPPAAAPAAAAAAPKKPSIAGLAAKAVAQWKQIQNDPDPFVRNMLNHLRQAECKVGGCLLRGVIGYVRGTSTVVFAGGCQRVVCTTRRPTWASATPGCHQISYVDRAYRLS